MPCIRPCFSPIRRHNDELDSVRQGPIHLLNVFALPFADDGRLEAAEHRLQLLGHVRTIEKTEQVEAGGEAGRSGR